MTVAKQQQVLEQMIEVLEYVEICNTKLKALENEENIYYEIFGTVRKRNHDIEITKNARERFAERYAKLKQTI